MAIALDQNLGTGGADTAGTTAVLTTAATVSANGFITIFVTWFDASGFTLSQVTSSPSLSWTIDKQVKANNLGLAIVSAQAPSGLASGSTITATYSGSVLGLRYIMGNSWTGVATSSPVDGTPPAVHNDSATAWTTNSYTIGNAGSVLIALAAESNTNLTSTPTSPAVELQDFTASGGGSSATAAYKLPGATGAATVAGTWSATTGTNNAETIAVAYLPSSGGTNATVTAVPLAGTGDLVAPTVTGTEFALVVAPPLSGTGDLVAPTVTTSGNATVVAVPLHGTGDLVAPTVSTTFSVTIVAVPLHGTGDLLAPNVSNGTFVLTVRSLMGVGL